MEKNSQIPISVGIPQNKIIQDLQFNSVHPRHHQLNFQNSPLVKRSSSERQRINDNGTELASFSAAGDHRSSPLVYNLNNNNNTNSYVSGNAKILSELLTVLQAMDKINIPVPVEVIPNLMNNRSTSGGQLRHQLSKGNVGDFSVPVSTSNALNVLTGRPGSDSNSQISKHYDAVSVKSYTSVGMGSTDGKKMIVRKIPTSPVELFNLVNPPM
ncbi:hypothetical protein QE152_g13496 [Popillia japonica]|uniref:Uncharacterized protein n=1 Tax=Popillia japonica TaxID=7064 RepID=A0AAW1LBX3_POPJA